MWITSDDIIGRVKGQAPYVGIVTILLNDYPNLKYLMLGSMALMVLSTREEQ